MDSKRRCSTNCNVQVNRGVFDLPEEIISDILSRLPIESILACRVVCQTWRKLTREQYFINGLGNSQHQPNRLILKALPGSGKDISDAPSHLVLLDIEERKGRNIPIEKMLVNLQIMCSCKDLLCMASVKKLNPVVIYNPITRARLNLPPSNWKSSVSRHEVGIGFDPSTKKYKVVRACTGFYRRRKVRRFEMISLGDRSWRELTAPQSMADRDASGVVSWNGALYWTMNKGLSFIMVQFDLSEEKFRVISFPDYFCPRQVSLGLLDIGGFLTLVQNDSNVVKFWRITEDRAGGDLSLCLQDTQDTHVKWGGALTCAFVCEINQESFLLQVGFSNCHRQRQEHLTLFWPEKMLYSNLEITGLPNSFKAIGINPSLLPLPA